MTHATQTWLVSSAMGFIFSLAIISLFETSLALDLYLMRELFLVLCAPLWGLP